MLSEGPTIHKLTTSVELLAEALERIRVASSETESPEKQAAQVHIDAAGGLGTFIDTVTSGARSSLKEEAPKELSWFAIAPSSSIPLSNKIGKLARDALELWTTEGGIAEFETLEQFIGATILSLLHSRSTSQLRDGIAKVARESWEYVCSPKLTGRFPFNWERQPEDLRNALVKFTEIAFAGFENGISNFKTEQAQTAKRIQAQLTTPSESPVHDHRSTSLPREDKPAPHLDGKIPATERESTYIYELESVAWAIQAHLKAGPFARHERWLYGYLGRINNIFQWIGHQASFEVFPGQIEPWPA